jgi:SPP1 gp7 family putative phage head morphogenesis protein
VRWESLVEAIKESGDVADSRAKLIARDQTSKINGAFTSVRQQSLGITKFVWQTAQDERVREEHADLDGEEYLWSEPPKEGMPGEAVNCRCIALPVFELDDEEEAASGGSFFGTVNALGAIGSFFGELANQA